jgi:pyruvate-formate lyase-activating enzyme
MKKLKAFFLIEFIRIKRFYNLIFKPIESFFNPPRLPKFPKNLTLELTSLCNASCAWCIHNKGLKRKSFMDFKLFKKIINECKGQDIKNICPSMYGEPLIQKDYLKYLRYIRKNLPNVKISLITNSTLLTEEISKKLIEENLIDKINFSIDSFTKNTCQKLKKIDYDKVIENINFFFKHKKLKSSKIRAGVSFVLCNENIQEWFDFKRFWKNRADYIHLAFDDGRFTNKHLINLKNISPCKPLFRDMNIISSGKVIFCCIDCIGKYPLGDLNTNSIKEVWCGKLFNNFRKMHIKYKKHKHPLCKNCDF